LRIQAMLRIERFIRDRRGRNIWVRTRVRGKGWNNDRMGSAVGCFVDTEGVVAEWDGLDVG
jgi:hypothetical protein